jgi:hypothetical protein
MRLNTPADRPFRRLGFLSSRLLQDVRDRCLFGTVQLAAQTYVYATL